VTVAAREGAAPEPVRATLFGKGALQSVDGEDHLRRKRFFLAMCGPGPLQAPLDTAEGEWRQHRQGTAWRRRSSPTRAACCPLAPLALRQLTGHSQDRLPPQDFSLAMDRMPALPRDRIVLEGFRGA
jgi:hypothetical protein